MLGRLPGVNPNWRECHGSMAWRVFACSIVPLSPACMKAIGHTGRYGQEGTGTKSRKLLVHLDVWLVFCMSVYDKLRWQVTCSPLNIIILNTCSMQGERLFICVQVSKSQKIHRDKRIKMLYLSYVKVCLNNLPLSINSATMNKTFLTKSNEGQI